jgi:hypothetical protein
LVPSAWSLPTAMGDLVRRMNERFADDYMLVDDAE